MAKKTYYPINMKYNANIDYYTAMRKISKSINNIKGEQLTELKEMISWEINKYTRHCETDEESIDSLHFLFSLFNQKEIICFLSLQHSEIFHRLLESQNRIFYRNELDLQQRLSEYLHKKYKNNKLPAKSMASENCMSIRKLQRACDKLISLSPTELLRVYRVIKSCVQIITTNHSLDRVSIDNGFHLYSSFYRSFKNCIYMTPKMFKRQYGYLAYLFS